nr:MAG TPA: hypothetical protein [Caudoviricetes sp.]
MIYWGLNRPSLPDTGIPLRCTAACLYRNACSLYSWRVCVSTSPKPPYYFLLPLR